jgi:hypothetical protein
VGDLVPDHSADCAVVHRIVGTGVEEGRLQDRGREHDLVVDGVVVRVHDVRRHEPLALVHGLAEPGQVALVGELVGAHPVLDEDQGADVRPREVLPLVR